MLYEHFVSEELTTNCWNEISSHIMSSLSTHIAMPYVPNITYVFIYLISTDKRDTVILFHARKNTRATKRCCPKHILDYINRRVVH